MHPSTPVRPTRRQGQALFVAIVFVGLVLSLTLTLSQIASTNHMRVVGNREADALMNLARAGLAQSRHELWEAYVAGNGGSSGNGAHYRAWLATQGLTAARDQTNPLALTTLSFAPATAGLPLLSSGTVTRSAFRVDEGDATYLVLSAEATAPSEGSTSRTRRAEEVLRMGGTPFQGFQFALLTNNVNCIFCHTRFDNVTRYYGPKDGSHERVKVASLETMMLRGFPDSKIAGTLYVQGKLLDEHGNVLSTPPGGFGRLQAYDMDTNGKIVDPSSTVNFALAHKDGSGDYDTPFENFYTEYSSDTTIDGRMPSSFPPVVPDENGNRAVDAAEWSAKASTMTGSLTVDGTSGSALVTVDQGSTYGGATLPSNQAGALASNQPGKNVILVGTADSPIVLDGDVAIDGDVVISGYVKGSGLLLARGNLYVVGDLMYADGVDADGNRTFGKAADGTENTVAFAAGGNVIHGAYNQKSTLGGANPGTTPDGETGGGFTVREMSLFNRTEWAKTQPYYDSATQRPTSTNTGVANSAYVPNYVPRYYTMGGSATQVQLFLQGTQWDNVNKVWTGAETGTSYTAITPPGVKGTDFVIRPMDPTDGWISGQNMLNMNNALEASRADGPVKLDGLLYSDNAVVLLSKTRSSTGGQAIVNGAIVAADTAILTAGQGNGGSSAAYPYSEYNESTQRTASNTYNEATYGVDLNGDGDISDTHNYLTIYNNRAAWGWNVERTGSGTSTRYRLDLNRDGNWDDRVRHVPPGYEGTIGLQLNYDTRTKEFLLIEDSSTVELFTVSRREW